MLLFFGICKGSRNKHRVTKGKVTTHTKAYCGSEPDAGLTSTLADVNSQYNLPAALTQKNQRYGRASEPSAVTKRHHTNRVIQIYNRL
jgi:hypothetical protein